MWDKPYRFLGPKNNENYKLCHRNAKFCVRYSLFLDYICTVIFRQTIIFFTNYYEKNFSKFLYFFLMMLLIRESLQQL